MRKKADHNITLKLASMLVMSMFSLSIAAQAPSPRPKLVVGIVIDGLQEEYIDLLKGYFGENGFKRLMRDGVMFDNVNFGTPLDVTAATAMLYSGASASANGIPATYVYDSDNRRQYPIILDASNIGNYTDETYSPKAIRVSTLSDEVRIDGGGEGNVYSISPSAHQAIIMASHAGNSAFWINDVNGRWATTTYYKDVPSPIQSRNYSKSLASRLDTMSWRPSMDMSKYPDVPKHKKNVPFKYSFPRHQVDRIANFKTAAPVNTEITELATDYITSLQLGKHDAMDMLNLGYTLAPFKLAQDADHRVETMDSYIKLDAELARLFQAIENNVGLSNTFVMVAGTPVAPSTKADDVKWSIPTGEFSARKAVSLLNVYLMAKHGDGDWVAGYHDGQIFLNGKLIKEHNLDIKDLRADASDFLTRMAGVSRVWTIDDIVAGKAGTNGDALKRNTQVDYAGDLHLEITPGWEIVTVDPTTQKENRTTMRTGLMGAPIFLLSPQLKAERISTEIDARAIAPTVARQLRIRSPNAVELPPMRLAEK
ncbi:MAG: alkaline phosphatase family protein [Muribaculum sp.]|nr:alkaline phosphatase family protein [Muribaculum sp.]